MLAQVIGLVLFLVVVGFCWWLAERYIPIPPLVRQIIGFIVVLAVILWILDLAGIYHFGRMAQH